MNPFHVPRRASVCCKGGEPLRAGDAYVSVLSQDYQRRDYCPRCFSAEDPLTPKTLGVWRGSIPEKREAPTTRTERALFELKRSEPPVAFVLSLFLARKKVIKLCGELPEHLLYEVVETEEMLSIEKVALSSLEVEAIQKTIADRLNDAPAPA